MSSTAPPRRPAFAPARPRVLAVQPTVLLAVLLAGALAAPAIAQPLVDVRLGPAGALHGDLVDDLDFDVGIGAGITFGWAVNDFLILEGRWDYLRFRSEGTLSATTPDVSFSASGDVEGETHALSVGASLRTREGDFEGYLGVHPGFYVSSLDLGGHGELGFGNVNVNVAVRTDESDDFGLNVAGGARWFVMDKLFVGAELAYHLILFEDEVDDEVGVIVGDLALGYAF